MRESFDESWFVAPLQSIGQETLLSPEDGHHLRRVLRIPPGVGIRVSNGLGTVFDCSTSEAGDTLRVRAEAVAEEQARPALNMALAVLKGRDLEEPIEGLCQLHIDSIQLIISDHSQVFKGQDHVKSLERLRQKSAVATKQAKKAWQTRILDPLPFMDWIRTKSSACVIAALPGPDQLPGYPQSSFHLLVGPEGGFSKAEMSALNGPGTYRLGLGSTRIRATHAPILAAGKLMGLGWV